MRDGESDHGDLFQDFPREQWLEGDKGSRKGICKLKKNFYTLLKVSLHLQLLQNIGSNTHVVQYILEPILLHPIVCTSHSPTPILPLPPPTGNH